MNQDVFACIQKADIGALTVELTNTPDAIRARDEHDRSALHVAARLGFRSGVHALLEAGSPVNELDDEGLTPVFHAVRAGHLEIASDLLRADAAVTISDPNGRTLLHAAAGTRQPDAARWLVEAGCVVNARAIGAATPLHYAAIAGDCETARVLLDAGADPNVICNEEITPLWWAIRRDDAEMVDLLLEAGSSPDYENYEGLSPLALAVCRGHAAIVRFLLEGGADRDFRQPVTGRSLVHLAALHGHTDIEAILRAGGSESDAQDVDGETPETLRARYGHRGPRASSGRKQELRPLIRYLGGSGWSVRTSEHTLLFDPPARGRMPSTASARSGWIGPADLMEAQTLWLVSHPSPDWPTSHLREEPAAFAHTTFVLPFDPKTDLQTVIARPGYVDEIDAVRVLPLGFGGQRRGVSYSVCADGLTIVHLQDWSYQNSSFDQELERALDAIGQFSSTIDVVFIDIPGGRQLVCLESWRALFKALRGLSAGLAVPMGHLYAEHTYADAAQEIARRLPGQEVAIVTAPGDTIEFTR